MTDRSIPSQVVPSPAAPAADGARSWLRHSRRLNGVLLVVALLVLWEVSARLGWANSANWPPVSAVFVALLQGLISGELLQLLASTLMRTASGYVIGCGAGVALGLLLGTNRWARYVLKPIVEVLRPIPAPAIVPPLILFLGVDNALKIFVISLACFFPVFLNTLAGVAGVDDVLLQTARTFRVSARKTLLSVVLPAALPMIAAGMRTATGIALVVTVIAEMIAGSAGLGYYIIQMQYALRPEAMYAAVICLAITGYLLNRAVLIAEARLIPWLGK
ncbi:MAG TPA: ABC transporter permease [Xanthobacteraceae bacterium]|nr:ABC transporter permease [Xanthobacteraceae bacterium]